MPQPHLRAAWEKHGRELASSQRLSPVKDAEFRALTDELKHRVTSNPEAINVYDRPVAGSAAGRSARVAGAMGEVSAAEAAAAARAGGRLGMRGALGPAANIALMILGAANTKEDIENAARIVQKVREERMTPSERRALHGREEI
jgi:hypothetical protein